MKELVKYRDPVSNREKCRVRLHKHAYRPGSKCTGRTYVCRRCEREYVALPDAHTCPDCGHGHVKLRNRMSKHHVDDVTVGTP